MSFPRWVTETMSEAASDLRDAVLFAIPRAHEDALAAQAASGTRKRDPYGHTMKNRQHERLVEAGRLIDGIEVIHPRGASFDLLQVCRTKSVLFPWRYATSSRVKRVDARMRTSGFRRDLLSIGESTAQLTLDHAGLSDDELDAQLAEQDAVMNELRKFAPVVTVGYASNPTGLLDLGWGVAELLDDSGAVAWRNWEPLPWLSSVHSAGSSEVDLTLKPLSLVSPTQADIRVPTRFDRSGPPLDDFELAPRSPLAGEPSSDAAPEVKETGTEPGNQP